MLLLRRVLAALVVALLFAEPSCLAAAQTSSTAVTPQDQGWPRQIRTNGATLVYYQPQIDSWKDYKELDGRFAFSLTPANGKTALGVVSVTAATEVNNETRTVYLHDVNYTSVRFQGLDEQTASSMETLLRSMAPLNPEPIALDRLIADLDHNKSPAGQAVAVNNDPPQIFYSTVPAILLMVHGDPVLNPIEKTDLESVINTNWDLFFEKNEKTYYLLENTTWLTGTALEGPWTATKTLPKDMSKLPTGQNWDDVKKVVPPPTSTAPVPKVFFSSKPAELIQVKGAPIYTKITGTRLLYVSNTDNDVFLDDAAQQYYVLLSGRWFHAQSMQGPWSYAGNDLPADFSKIPEDSKKGRVLASVAGTIQASDAVMLAQIPTTVTVNKAEAEAKVKVTYQGDPQFKPIESTNLEYATNTQDKVIKDGDLYYLCFQGIWFMSTTPNGPWKTADSVPKDIYTIPPSSPVYNVTYVTQSNPTETTVDSSTTAGYFGMFVIGMTAGMAITYGTGYYYPPYYYWGPGVPYPVYYPWPMTYGAGVAYNPWTGGWAAGRAVYGPYGAAGSSAWYNPATGRYGRAASVQGWYGGRTVASAYNPWTGGYGATSQGHNAYSQWGTSVAARNGQAIQTGHVTTAAGTVAGYRTSTGERGAVVHGAGGGTVVHGSNGTYAGNDGNVYRKNGDGSWSQYNNGSWNTVDTSAAKQQAQQNFQTNHPNAQQNVQNARDQSNPPTLGASQGNHNLRGVSPSTMEGLNRSAEARQRGQFQTQRFQNFHRGGGRFRR